MDEEVKIDEEVTEEKNAPKEKNDTQTVYEFSYLLVPTISEDGLAAEFTSIKDRIVASGAAPISEEHPKKMELAYEMRLMVAGKSARFNEAYFGWIKFDLAPEKLVDLEKSFARDEKIIRYLLIKTVRENTMSQKKMFVRSDVAKKRYVPKKEDVDATPIDKETLDKEIDALVTPEAALAPVSEVVE